MQSSTATSALSIDPRTEPITISGVFKRFNAMLCKPPASNARLERLLNAGNLPSMIGSGGDLCKSEESGASRTYVLYLENGVGEYYALAVGAVTHPDAPGRVRRDMADPLPVMVISRLAIDQSVQGQSMAPALLRDGVLRTIQAAEIAGIRGHPGARDLGQGEALLREVGFYSFGRRADDPDDNSGRSAESPPRKLKRSR